MNNYIIISRTFDETTTESASFGEYSDMGFVNEREEVSFSELVSLMKEHPCPSRSPNKGSTNTWYSTHQYITDYKTGTYRGESIHFHKDNTPNAAKYWTWAARMAGNTNE